MNHRRKVRPNHPNAVFSLLELLIVVAIILIISAIAIPKLLSARTAAVESSAVSSSRNLVTALAVYDTKWGTFPATLTPLGGTCNTTTPPTATLACLMDTNLVTALAAATGENQYVYTYAQVATGADFTLNADPLASSSATKHIYADSGLTLHANNTAKASVTDPTI